MSAHGAYLPAALCAGRAWGFGINLYGMRSKRNWGIGDFTDLRAFVALAKTLGAGFVGVNPLHALQYLKPEAASPYSPASRYFLNPLYVNVEAVPEFRDASARGAALRERIAARPFADALASLRRTAYVDYAGVARAKHPAFEELFAISRERGGPREDAFRTFNERGGERLERFARHQALAERFAGLGTGDAGWAAWPDGFRDADSASVVDWAQRERTRIDYFKFLQWIADEQLASAAAEARTMALGLYLDIAVGVDAASADVWSDPGAYVMDESVGAPPDPLGPDGQDWQFPPPRPEAMLRDEGAAFAGLLRANMHHAGAVRLDHVMALARLFRIPKGRSPRDGAYVAYPLDALLAIASSESVRARCVVIGEDLGTVPDGFRERMVRARVFSYRLLLFERDARGDFLPPGAYPQLALATFTTHDLPTLYGWAAGRDIDARAALSPSPAHALQRAHAERRADVSRLLETLVRHHSLCAEDAALVLHTLEARPDGRAALAALVRGAYRYVACSAARLVLVQLDDVLGELDQVNMPGTASEYPNWRRKSALDLDHIASDGTVGTLAAEMLARVTGEADG